MGNSELWAVVEITAGKARTLIAALSQAKAEELLTHTERRVWDGGMLVVAPLCRIHIRPDCNCRPV